MAVVFGVICAVALLWSAIKYQRVYFAMIDLLPPQFQGGDISRYAVPEYALRPSTPLELQTEYMECLACGCVAMPCFSLACFLGGQPAGGLLALAGSIAIVVSTIRAWKAYKENCRQQAAPAGREDL